MHVRLLIPAFSNSSQTKHEQHTCKLWRRHPGEKPEAWTWHCDPSLSNKLPSSSQWTCKHLQNIWTFSWTTDFLKELTLPRKKSKFALLCKFVHISMVFCIPTYSPVVFLELSCPISSAIAPIFCLDCYWHQFPYHLPHWQSWLSAPGLLMTFSRKPKY